MVVFGDTTLPSPLDLGSLDQYSKLTVTNLGVELNQELKLGSQIKKVVGRSF